ncbi:putative serine threonine-protein kinase ppk6 protein [Phaeoacremonium minimum UCRPA7]|uniref:Putative serine threonine-protein kinase ppk6 protein n=1 Tax=Phaeoacremonium minimum (strain UCR-PA7) TaxID=1286976 RepID=R8BXR1_PHAM7|nr:putative serine threonine-protein kinase ppk6 protein [Phaeoacremonium minimum UCRPA7]EOO04115.1 putative serine threonine-protein kinase ppk6 protein [Phaeoacremonium minimum UCRPA7]
MQAKPSSKPKNTDPNVLFDADDFDGVAPPDDDEDDDDFGDFETGDSDFPKPAPVPASKPTPAPAIIDLMSTDYVESAPAPARKQPPTQLLSTLSLNISPTSPYPNAPKSPSYQERNPFPGMGIVTPVSAEFPKDDKLKSPSPITAWPSIDNQPSAAANDDFGDDWGAFEDLPPKAATAPSLPKAKPTVKAVTKPAPKPAPEPVESTWDWDAVDPVESSTSQIQSQAKTATAVSSIPDSAPPPTNIPPPSILLSIFPSLLSQASTSLFKPTASQPASVRTRVLASPEAASFLQAYLLLATVAARVLAGRKLRWHRDKFLAQGMSISAAGGKGGMKLAGVDKAQSAREDREAADVVALWRESAGRLRSAVAAVNAGRKDKGGEPPLHMPELGEHLAVQTAKTVPTAPKPCVVCGLRRDERVKGVDFEVEDSFGEWWVEHWGHRACRNFWLEHEAQLRSR